MIKGSQAKADIFAKLLEVFPNSFMYNDGKECRINMDEDGNNVQIKVTLTMAKAPVEPDDSPTPVASPEKLDWSDETAAATAPKSPVTHVPTGPSEEEKANIARLVAKLGL